MQHEVHPTTTFSSKKTADGLITNSIIELTQSPAFEEGISDEEWAEFEQENKIREYTFQELIDVHADAAKISAADTPFKARGGKARIKTRIETRIEKGGLPENLNPYLRKKILLTGGPKGPIGLQFIAQPGKENPAVLDPTYKGYQDSLIEDDHTEVDGVVHKYENRALVITTGRCAAYCRFCTRGRLVGIEKHKTKQEVDAAFEFIARHPEIRELIFSGGDPFTLPEEIFAHVIDRLITLEDEDKLDSVRFGSRFLIHSGEIPEHVYEHLKRLPLSPHVMLHINHPYEITKQVKDGMDKLRAAGARLYSQSVLLAGVNDDKETIKQLLIKVDKHGAIPYYVFTCDPVAWGAHFKVTLRKIREIFTELRSEMTGVTGMVRVVIDVPGGYGKITLDEGFWISERRFKDFHGQVFEFDEHDNVVKVESSYLEKNSGYAHGEVPTGSHQEQYIFQGGHNFD